MPMNFPFPWNKTNLVGINNIGTTGSPILSANSQRVAITFHNPGTQTIYPYSNGLPVPPNLSALGGAYMVLPGAEVTIYGGDTNSISSVNGAWSAFAAGGSGNPITIMEMYS